MYDPMIYTLIKDSFNILAMNVLCLYTGLCQDSFLANFGNHQYVCSIRVYNGREVLIRIAFLYLGTYWPKFRTAFEK